jgi:pimeloyl-ACP methyl ester carboxylesterase
MGLVEFEAHGGVVLRGDAWGDPAAPAVLLLHGGGQTRHSWSGTGEALAAHGWYAVSLDLRGHGDSDWASSGRYAIDDFAADLCAVAPAFDPLPAVVGASLGGMMALLAEGESPEPVASAVVLVDVTPRIEPEGVRRIIDFMTERPDGFDSLEQVADSIAAYLPHRPRPEDLSGLEKNLRRGDDGRWRWHWDPNFMGQERGPGDVYAPDRLIEAAKRLEVPTLLVRGKLSDVVSEQGAAEFLAAAPHASFVDVRGAGHMVAGDRNDRFTDAVVSFLRGLRPRGLRGLRP